MQPRSVTALFLALLAGLGALLNWWGRIVDLFNLSEDTKAMLASVQKIEADWGIFIFLIGLIGLALTFAIPMWQRRCQNAAETDSPKCSSGLIPPAVEGSGPNWTVLSLVQHMREAGIDVVLCMREIEDKARLGQLAVWGRKYSAANPHENPNPLRPIETDHWDHYCLDVTRCAYAEDASTCCTEPRSSNLWEHDYTESFQDLRVNKAQATALWPSGGDLITGNAARMRLSMREQVSSSIVHLNSMILTICWRTLLVFLASGFHTPHS